MNRIKHPAARMTEAQRRDFELVAVGGRPAGGYRTISALMSAGLIEEGEMEVVGHDSLGPVKRRRWFVPIPVHQQWCEWCASREPRSHES